MKKLLVLIAATAILCCCNSNVPKTEDSYAAAMEEIFQRANQEIESLPTDEQKEACSEKYVKEIKDFTYKVIKANRDSLLSVMALVNVCHMFTREEFDKAVSMLGTEMAERREITEIKSLFLQRDATAEGKQFIDFEVNGVKFSDFVGKGKYVLVDFWASWCGPCRQEIPNIKAVYETYAGEDFDVLSVAVWDKVEDTAKAAEEEGIVWNQIVDAQQIPTDIYSISGIPHIMLIGPDGTILKRDLRGSAIEAAVKEALGK